jgi:hypothetical protein
VTDQNLQQTHKPTPDEDIRELYSRIAKLNDQMAALHNPGWGAKTGLLPEDHPLHPSQSQAVMEIREDRETPGALHELASSVRDLVSAIRLETADRANPTPAPADTPLRQRIAKAIHRNRFPDSSWDRQPEQVRADYLDCAAAILAVVQPELRVAAALHRSAETDVTRVIELAERWRQQPDRQDAYLELVAALGYGQPPTPAHNAGPSVAECAAQDDAHWAERQWGGE